MKRVLYLAFFFPPLGGAGVQRTVKFVRYLPEFDWSATVVTANAAYWLRDASLATEISPTTKVLRTPCPGARFLGGGQGGSGRRSHARTTLLRRIARGLLVPDAYLGWAWHARRAAARELRDAAAAGAPYHAVITTSSPDSVHLAGRALRRQNGPPWLADFRDPWTRRLAYTPPTRWHDRLHRHLESSCLRAADLITVTTEETRDDFLQRYPGETRGRIEVIPNGYDEEDFVRAEQEASPPAGEEDEGPVLLHAGQLNPERPLTPFLRGLREAVDQASARGERFRVVFLGAHYDLHRDEVCSFDLESVVAFLPPREHVEAVAALRRARALLLLEDDSDRGRLVLPGKAFEYLRSGRPILAVVPRGGAAERTVRATGGGDVVDPASPSDIARGMKAVLTPGRAGADPGSIRIYERRALASRLASLLDRVAG